MVATIFAILAIFQLNFELKYMFFALYSVSLEVPSMFFFFYTSNLRRLWQTLLIGDWLLWEVGAEGRVCSGLVVVTEKRGLSNQAMFGLVTL